MPSQIGWDFREGQPYVGAVEAPTNRRLNMQAITVGLDIAKSVFQVHGVEPDFVGAEV